MGKSVRGLGGYANQSFHRSLDPFADGTRRATSFTENITRAGFNSAFASRNNAPGAEFLRHGYQTNMANMMSQEMANSMFWSPRGRKRR
jgi:hypothetical protein